MAIHSSILSWRIPWAEEPGGHSSWDRKSRTRLSDFAFFLSCPQYSVPQTELRGRVLSLSVWHRESLGRNIFLGEVEVPLDTWDWDSEPTWLPLQPRVSSWPAWGDPGPDLPPLPHRAFPQSPSPSKP